MTFVAAQIGPRVNIPQLRPSGRTHPAYMMGLSCIPESAELSRTVVSTTLACWGLGSLIDDAKLIVSELVTNAIVHTGRPCPPWEDPGRCRLSVELTEDVLRISVSDASPGRPHLRHPETGEESGRGLMLVDFLADRWSVQDRIPGNPTRGKTVWAELKATRGAK